ncbi:hypothetical protein BWZ29_21715 [Enterobacter cancerogenus]|nr:hypothetical protein BWZ29_21715 [Enterobacter cancerogenus]
MKIIVTLSCFLLSGCVVDNMDSSNYKYVRYAQTFQKPGPGGYTDNEQRKKDLYFCGVDKDANLDDGSYNGGSSRPDQTLQEIVARNDKISNCMKQKGYTVYSYDECGPLKAPTGRCPN